MGHAKRTITWTQLNIFFDNYKAGQNRTAILPLLGLTNEQFDAFLEKWREFIGTSSETNTAINIIKSGGTIQDIRQALGYNQSQVNAFMDDWRNRLNE